MSFSDAPIPVVIRILLARAGTLEHLFETLSVDEEEHWVLQSLCCIIDNKDDAYRCYKAASMGHKHMSMIALSKKHRFLSGMQVQKNIIVAMFQHNCPPCERMCSLSNISPAVISQALRKTLYFSMPLDRSLTMAVERLNARDIKNLPRFLRYRLEARIRRECCDAVYRLYLKKLDAEA